MTVFKIIKGDIVDYIYFNQLKEALYITMRIKTHNRRVEIIKYKDKSNETCYLVKTKRLIDNSIIETYLSLTHKTLQLIFTGFNFK